VRVARIWDTRDARPPGRARDDLARPGSARRRRRPQGRPRDPAPLGRGGRPEEVEAARAGTHRDVRASHRRGYGEARARRQARATEEELAERLGIGIEEVRAIEAGEVQLNTLELAQIGHVLGTGYSIYYDGMRPGNEDEGWTYH
jgi:ribosome-binding protein aMBF1 (putative translation factor)